MFTIEVKMKRANVQAKVSRDGNKWCVLAGEDIQEGVCGFGDTINRAIFNFVEAFYSEKIENSGL